LQRCRHAAAAVANAGTFRPTSLSNCPRLRRLEWAIDSGIRPLARWLGCRIMVK